MPPAQPPSTCPLGLCPPSSSHTDGPVSQVLSALGVTLPCPVLLHPSPLPQPPAPVPSPSPLPLSPPPAPCPSPLPSLSPLPQSPPPAPCSSPLPQPPPRPLPSPLPQSPPSVPSPSPLPQAAPRCPFLAAVQDLLCSTLGPPGAPVLPWTLFRSRCTQSSCLGPDELLTRGPGPGYRGLGSSVVPSPKDPTPPERLGPWGSWAPTLPTSASWARVWAGRQRGHR